MKISTIHKRQNLNQIVIKPNDQSLVGKFIKWNLWQDCHYGEVLFVGKEKVLLRMLDGKEELFSINSNYSHAWWEIFKLKRKPQIRCIRIKDF